MAITRLFAKLWAPLPSHRREGLSASATIHAAIFFLLASFSNAPQATPDTTLALDGMTVETIDGGEIGLTPDDTVTPEQRGRGPGASDAPSLDADGGLL